MKIAIHHQKDSFSERWIAYCKKNNISYKIVNAYENDIIDQIADCDAFLWNHHHGKYSDLLFAKQLIYALQLSGKNVFPDFQTTWHFDDKIGQKYFLEAIGAPIVPSYVFYSELEALEWVQSAVFPKVYKLKGGAGSQNVKLINNRKEGIKLTKKAFKSSFDRVHRFRDRKSVV